jgi:hypothetical protein
MMAKDVAIVPLSRMVRYSLGVQLFFLKPANTNEIPVMSLFRFSWCSAP